MSSRPSAPCRIFWAAVRHYPCWRLANISSHSYSPCRTFYVYWSLLDKMSGRVWPLCRTSAEVCRTCPACPSYFATTVIMHKTFLRASHTHLDIIQANVMFSFQDWQTNDQHQTSSTFFFQKIYENHYICFSNDVAPGFECKVEVYCHKQLDDFTIASTPKKLKKRMNDLSSSIGRSVGKRLSGMKDETDFTSNMLV